MMWIATLVGLTFSTLIKAQDNACSAGDFCTYQCHCNNQCPRQDGLCPNNAKCDMGWFGLRCQYQDLVTIQNVTISTDNPITTNLLTDRDDRTCYTGQNLTSVTVSWDKEYPFTWLRIVMSESNMLSTVSVMYSTTLGYKECEKQNWSRLDQGTVDIRCEDIVLMKSLKLVGNLSSLCSLYISGGRNLAYRQSATQSSDYTEKGTVFTADLAVDGNTSAHLFQNSCTHTDVKDIDARFDLRFNQPYVVNRFILYNRARLLERLQRFRLQTLDVNNHIVDNFKDTSTSTQLIYFINGNATNAIISLSVKETQKVVYDINPFVTLCELEAFGECPSGKWSLPCTKVCNTSCPTSCHRDDGSCNTVCAGYSNPPECNKACVPSKWGINCANDCSTGCVDTSCDSKTGLCDRGCLGYSDPPYCTDECSTDGHWGINCSQLCSSNCMASSCNVFTGACDQGCKPGYQLPDCTQACTTGYWGNNCSIKCKNCHNDECNVFTGACIFGCKDGFYLTNCTQAIQVSAIDITSFGVGIGAGMAVTTFITVLYMICRNRVKKRARRAGANSLVNHLQKYEHVYVEGNPQGTSNPCKSYTINEENLEMIYMNVTSQEKENVYETFDNN